MEVYTLTVGAAFKTRTLTLHLTLCHAPGKVIPGHYYLLTTLKYFLKRMLNIGT